jgi:hypothetical protein
MPEILPQEKLLDLRKRILAGEEPTDEEVGSILTTLRAQRGNIGTAANPKRKTPAKPIDLNALFDKPPAKET